MTTTWEAGHVNRWHHNTYSHALRNSGDTVHQHTARVCHLLLYFWPDIERDVLISALNHDLPECAIGDMSSEAKREQPLIAELLGQLEQQWHDKHGTHCETDPRIKFCDLLDAYLWMLHVDHARVWRYDWQDARETLRKQSLELGVAIKCDDIISGIIGVGNYANE